MDAAREWILFILLIAGGAIIAFAAYRLLSRKIDRTKGAVGPGDSTFRDIATTIDQSVIRYENRNVTKLNDTINWGCSSRLFSFDVSLQHVDGRYVLSLYLRHPLPYDFRLKPPDNLPVDPGVQAVLEAPDVRNLTKGLDFFDWIVVHKGGITARIELSAPIHPGDWKRALTAAITLLRYLMHVQQMANIAVSPASDCPYCRQPVKPEEPAVRCRQCNTLHHRECWYETEHCGVLGCDGKTEIQIP